MTEQEILTLLRHPLVYNIFINLKCFKYNKYRTLKIEYRLKILTHFDYQQRKEVKMLVEISERELALLIIILILVTKAL